MRYSAGGSCNGPIVPATRKLGGAQWSQLAFSCFSTNGFPSGGVRELGGCAGVRCVAFGGNWRTTYRLPSESEWEYAARAGTITKYSWGNQIGHNQANCDGCGSRWDDDRTAPVGAFAPNAFGLHDMHGNVWEWVEDCLNDSYYGAPTTGDAWGSGKCARRVRAEVLGITHQLVSVRRSARLSRGQPGQTPWDFEWLGRCCIESESML